MSGRPLSRSFYFGYDTAVLNPADLAALEMHAQILRRNADKSVVIEGHCDERGTREYNLALTKSRSGCHSNAAGVRSRQIETVSFVKKDRQIQVILSPHGHSIAARYFPTGNQWPAARQVVSVGVYKTSPNRRFVEN